MLQVLALQVAFGSTADALLGVEQQDQTKTGDDQEALDDGRILDGSVKIFAPTAFAMADETVRFGELGRHGSPDR